MKKPNESTAANAGGPHEQELPVSMAFPPVDKEVAAEAAEILLNDRFLNHS